MRKAFLILLGLAVGLTFSELGLRFWDGYQNSRENSVNFYDCADKLYAHDPLIGWRLAPNQSCRQRTVEYDVEYKTNGKGLRDDEEHTYRNDSGGKRIIILGDSHTFGQGVPLEETFGKVLEEKTGAEVLNLGVAGYDAGQYYLALKAEGMKYDPDIVVLDFYFLNDIDEINVGSFSGPKPIFYIEDGVLNWKNTPDEVVPADQAPKEDYRVKNKEIYKLTKWIFGLKTFSLAKVLAKEYFYEPLSRLGLVKNLSDYDDKFALFEEIVKRTKELLPNKTLAAVLIPSKNIKYNWLERQIGGRVASILENEKIPFIDLTQTVISGRDLYLPKDGHINGKGHEMVAEAIAKLLGFPTNK